MEILLIISKLLHYIVVAFLLFDYLRNRPIFNRRIKLLENNINSLITNQNLLSSALKQLSNEIKDGKKKIKRGGW